MDHREIEERHTVARYLAGRLSEDEAARFEEHYLDCETCLENLEIARRLRRGLEAVADDAVYEPAGAARKAPGGNVLRFQGLRRIAGSRAAALLAAAALLIAALPSTLLWTRADHLNRLLDQAHSELASSRVAQREAARRLSQMEQALQERDATDARRAAELDEALARAGAGQARLEDTLAREHRPRINTPILHLSPLRSAATPREPETRLALSSQPEWLVLVLDLGGFADGLFHVALSEMAGPEGGEGRSVWQSGQLEPDASGSLVVSLHTSWIGPGDYQLSVRSVESSGSAALRMSYSFRLTGS